MISPHAAAICFVNGIMNVYGLQSKLSEWRCRNFAHLLVALVLHYACDRHAEIRFFLCVHNYGEYYKKTDYQRTFLHHRHSHSFNHILYDASLGILQSPRGDKETLPTFGPSGRHERLNCWVKNLL